MPASRSLKLLALRDGIARSGRREVPEEVAVAVTYDGSTHAVMMATPADLDDFALGFTLTEGIASAAGEIEGVEVLEVALGMELRIRLAAAPGAALAARRRRMAGPTGCGLCGVESLEEALRPLPFVAAETALAPADIAAAMSALAPAQALNRATRATHAAAFWRPGAGLVAVREDVGRHNALDKLVGHLFATGTDAGAGVVLMTSRVSVEIVQKAASIGASILVAVSAPTALAVRMAQESGMTLIAVARDDQFEVFTHPERIGGITVPA